jgi:small subunit ribosomal protein S3
VGQKVNPVGFRTGVYRDWAARWFASNATYGKQILEDIKIRNLVATKLKHAEISKVEIEKAGDNIRIILHSGRVGVVIGKGGKDIDSLRQMFAKALGKNNVEISVQEVKKPELDAVLVAQSIADQLERRVSYKRAMKRAMAATMRAGAQGTKVSIAGRLNGAEIARTEWLRLGSVPLHTLRADIDYGNVTALTVYGIIGVKVWISRGEYQHEAKQQ